MNSVLFAVGFSCLPCQTDYTPTVATAGMIARVKQSGWNKFTNQKSWYIVNRLLNYQFLDQLQIIALSYNIDFKDLRFKEVEVDQFQSYFGDNPHIIVDFPGLFRLIQFDFKMKQQVYPYFEDAGIGQFRFHAAVLFSAYVKESPKCQYVINFQPNQGQIDIKKLQIEIVSDFSFLYDSITNLIEEVTKAAFVSLTDQLMQLGFIELNKFYDSEHGSIFWMSSNQNYGQDIRMITMPTNSYLGEYYETYYPGYFCKRDSDNSCTGIYIDENERIIDSLIPKKATSNYDYQFYYHKGVFNSLYNLLFQEVSHNLIDKVTLQQPIKIIKFSKTGVIAKTKILQNGKSIQLVLFGKLRMLVKDKLMFYEISFVQSHTPIENETVILAALNEIYRKYYLSYFAEYCESDHYLQIINEEWIGGFCNLVY